MNFSLVISISRNGLLVSLIIFLDGVWLHSKEEMRKTLILFQIMLDNTFFFPLSFYSSVLTGGFFGCLLSCFC